MPSQRTASDKAADVESVTPPGSVGQWTPSADVWCGDGGIDDGVVATLQALQRGGTLSSLQARLLFESWPTLEDDWAANPYFGTVREHTRVFIERARKALNERRSDPALNQERKVIPHVQPRPPQSHAARPTRPASQRSGTSG